MAFEIFEIEPLFSEWTETQIEELSTLPVKERAAIVADAREEMSPELAAILGHKVDE